MSKLFRTILIHFVVCSFVCSFACAGDWPQILGPNRNCIAENEKLADSWESAQPKPLWEFEVGEGYAGPAVKDDRLVIFHRVRGQERLDCIDARTKERFWSTAWNAAYRGGIDRDRGPRCVPIISGDRVFVFGAGGNLRCINFADGRELWKRALAKDYKAQDGYFGFGSTPLLIGKHLLVNVGGETRRRVGNSIVSLDPATGETQWTAVDDAASYSSPIAWQTKDETNAIFVSRFKLTGIRPSDGKILFQTPFGGRGPTVNGATPSLIGKNRLFVTASYGIGSMSVSLDATKAKPTVNWKSDDILSSQYPTPVFAAGHLFGVHGREDGAPASLRCVDPTTQSVKWKQDRVGMAHVILADDKLLVMTTEGELRLVELSADAYREKGRVQIGTETTRALPALSNGRLFVKDVGGTLTAWKLPTKE